MQMNTSGYTYDEDILSDIYKDAYGFRPRENFWLGWDSSTSDQKQKIWDELCDISSRAADEERQAQLAAEAALERQIEKISRLVVGGTREDAIRYLHDVHNTHGDREFLEYSLGVRYGYLSGNVRKDF
jgi:hypothetical protein